jgi:hypothetical protein
MKKQLLFILFSFLLFPGFISASSFEISGTVCDSVTHTALPDVLVSVKEKSGQFYTDALGHFHITGLNEEKAELYFFLPGYRQNAVTVNLSGNENIVVSLAAKSVSLAEVTIAQRKDISQTISTIGSLDMKLRPVNSAQDLLRLVPGLFIAQHAGGGKAEQIFLRGFDCDHGTDFAVFIDGMPVNMVSHAHGQGYADFHFVIPETVDHLSVSKGPYAARYGDFATSGAGEFFTKNNFTQNEVKLEYGMFDTYRALGIFTLPQQKHLFSKRPESFYIASEYYFSNSYFENHQHFNRYNVFTKYSGQLSGHTSLSFSASTFGSRWDASGQIPERAIAEGIITRFGTIDNSEGGETSRTNANLLITTSTNKNSVYTHRLYYSYYTFNLYSDFTFFLHDTINGDEISQKEYGRTVSGYSGTFEKYDSLFGKEARTTIGAGMRIDEGENGLFHDVKRMLLDTISVGRLSEENIFAYADENLKLTEKLSVYAGLRSDNFIFGYKNYFNNNLSGNRTVSRVSPKLSIYYSPSANVQLYIRSGYGYHSNDVRSVVTHQAGNALPRALGYETGATFKAGKNFLFNIAAWGLDLQNELVYVGDEAVVEINGASRRLGIDLDARWQILPCVFADADVNYNHGELLDLPKGHNYIPLAPRLTSTGGLTLKKEKGFSVSLRYRYMDSRPANEDNTVTAKGYFLLDAVAAYSIKNIQWGLSAQNLLNSPWNEAQFDTVSRLHNESMPVSELHFTPGTPFFIKGSISVQF